MTFGNYVFMSCSSLTSVTIPSGTNIHTVAWVFYSCSSLRTVIISEGIQYIGNTFDSCDNIENITLPSTLVSFDYQVPGASFPNYTKLSNTKITKVVVPCTTPPTIGYNTFGETVEFEVPVGRVSTYKSASIWSSRHVNYIYSKPSIKYYSNGSLYREIVYKSGTSVTVPANPIKTGYIFTNWDPSVPSTMPDQNLTVTAVFRMPVLTFMSDGQVYATIEQVGGTSVTPPQDPTKYGYNFTGWGTSVPSTMPNYDMTFTAQFVIGSYTMTAYVDNTVYWTYSNYYNTGVLRP